MRHELFTLHCVVLARICDRYQKQGSFKAKMAGPADKTFKAGATVLKLLVSMPM
jgi:hypothetical protein